MSATLKEFLYLIFEQILSFNSNYLKKFLIAKNLIILIKNLKIYKKERNLLFYERKTKKFKETKQFGAVFLILIFLFTETKENFIFLIFSLIDDFYELSKTEKVKLTFEIFLYKNDFSTSFYFLFKNCFVLQSINILSGINGIELFQLILFLKINFYQKKFEEGKNFFELVPLFIENMYPADCFIGNAVLIYYSFFLCDFQNIKNINFENKININFEVRKELRFLCLFFLQILNAFLFFVQVTFFVCPRHRMPQLNLDSNKRKDNGIQSSYFIYKNKKMINFTVLNFLIRFFGIKKERDLFIVFVCIQLLFVLLYFLYPVCI